MAFPAHILLVDDDPMMLEIEKFQLGDNTYRYSTASHGLEALSIMAADKPDVVLLDISMPELDGLETCRRIRADAENAAIHILFVTAQDTPETRKAAYESGGDDILSKPLNPTELQRKVASAIHYQDLVAGLRKQMSEAMGIVMTAMISSGKYGVVMNAMRQSLACRSLGDLAEVVIKTLDEFGLNGSIQLRTQHHTLTLNSERRCSPLEQEMLRNLSLENRHIYDYGNRTAFCYPNTAILIKNMPLDDMDTYGQIKDNIALLAEGVETRLNALVEEIRVRQQRETLAGSVAMVSQVLDRVDAMYKRGQSEMANIFTELERGLEWSFSGLGLTEDQEQSLWRVVRPLGARATQLYDEGHALDEQLAGALQSLRLSMEEGGHMGEQDIWFDGET